MPWVLRDYSSPRLDLADPASYRDLARPIGAQTEERRRLFRSRYAGWADADGVPPFHYGSHYSSAAYVLWCARRRRSMDGVRVGDALPGPCPRARQAGLRALPEAQSLPSGGHPRVACAALCGLS